MDARQPANLSDLYRLGVVSPDWVLRYLMYGETTIIEGEYVVVSDRAAGPGDEGAARAGTSVI
jgi:hypothetical protein